MAISNESAAPDALTSQCWRFKFNDMKYVRWLSIAAYLSLAVCWLLDVFSLREIIPFYVIAAGSVAVAFLLPRTEAEDCDDPTFGRWFIDRYGFVAVLVGTLLFAVSSGLIYNQPIDLNIVSNTSIGITVSGILSSYVPRSWFRRNSRIAPKAD